MTNKHPSLFSPFMLTEKIKLRNRIVMAPMTTWSANPDGTISEQELEFYKRRSQN
ncbi:NADH:flavin oxidoreductase, partial [Escherichia coli]|nr:NADH:flavin oxidoreductase [Escherichia coli]